jgi:hypothetical protein
MPGRAILHIIIPLHIMTENTRSSRLESSNQVEFIILILLAAMKSSYICTS